MQHVQQWVHFDVLRARGESGTGKQHNQTLVHSLQPGAAVVTTLSKQLSANKLVLTHTKSMMVCWAAAHINRSISTVQSVKRLS